MLGNAESSARSFVACLLSFACLAMACGPARAQTGQPTYLDQGWTEADKQTWYTLSQGSRLLPLSWWSALEQAGSTDKYMSDSNIRKFGYLPTGTPGMPVGFVTDQGPAPEGGQQAWVGMTCAACHTGEFTYGQHRVRVHGAPALADFQSFMEGLHASLVATRSDAQKLDRFVAAVLGAGASAEDRNRLIADLGRQAAWLARLLKKNDAPNRYGHGRVDAQGWILNTIALRVGAAEPLIDFPADAPASYPFLWATPRHTPSVQWNGIAFQPLGDPQDFKDKKYDTGAMVRNTTELIGVFSSVDVAAEPYPSSLRFENMIDLENVIDRLKSPRWPQHILPPIDAKLVDDGRKLFTQHKCGECHAVLDPATELQNKVAVKLIPLGEIGTDVWLACNTYLHESKAGLLEGRLGLGPIANVDRTYQMLLNMSFNMILKQQKIPREPVVNANDNLQRQARRAPAGAVRVLGDDGKEQRAQRCRTDDDPMLVYKPPLLNGVWSTAPYLHNGSVASLYELLLPPDQRRAVFWIGGTEFDPKDVGFKSGPSDGPFEFRIRDAAGKIIPGNDNAGHPYGTGATDAERRALIEFLKTL